MTDLEAPAVTDKDSDGKLDTEEYTEADEAVKKAEEAYKKAEEAIAKYPEGSVVNPDEQQAVQDLIDEAQQLKEQAQAVVKDLPAGDTKDGYQGRLKWLDRFRSTSCH